MTKREQVEQMAKERSEIKDIMKLLNKCVSLNPMCKAEVATIIYGNNYRKIPEDSVVLSGEEYEMLVNQYKNLEIKYSNLCDNYRLCKDANETLKQNIIITRKEIAENFYDKVNENICVFQLENKNQEFTDGYAQAIADICGRLDQVAKQFGVEIKE